jgi:GGDEF domain-containing protein
MTVVRGRVDLLSQVTILVVVALVVARLVLLMRDNAALTAELERIIVELDKRREELHVMAYNDPLTGLANRVSFTERVEQSIRNADGSPDLRPTVFFVDLDGFKSVNDRLGHHAGDELLSLVAQRIRGCVRSADIVAQLGGDEFAVLMDGPIEAGLAEHRAAPQAGSEGCGELLRNADLAMYAAKALGKARYVTYSPRLHDNVTASGMRRHWPSVVQR